MPYCLHAGSTVFPSRQRPAAGAATSAGAGCTGTHLDDRLGREVEAAQGIQLGCGWHQHKQQIW